jgi:hypothetical protein
MSNNRIHSERGATMLAALSFASVLAISLASYIAVSYNTLERVDAQVTAASTLLKGENVLEETLHRVSTADLTGWSQDGSSASRTVTGLDLAQLADSIPVDFNETVTIEKPKQSAPRIPDAFLKLFIRLGFRLPEPAPAEDAAEVNPDEIQLQLTGLEDGSNQRTLTLTQSTKLEDGSIETRTLTATMSPLSPFQAAITADRTIRLRRNGIINSYDSRIGPYGGDNVGYEAVLTGNHVSISRAQISGYAAGVARSPYFGRRATLRGPETDLRIKIDPTRVVPTPYKPNLDTQEASGVGSLFGGPGSRLGSSGSPTARLYYANDINLRRDENIVVEGPTRLIVDGDLNLRDNAAIVINEQGSLEIHVDGNVNLNGRGIVNLSEIPANVAIIGTNSDRRSIVFRGEEALHGAIYAPNSDFYAYGNRKTRTIFGAIVARQVIFDDDTNFHFDVALREAHFDGVEKAFAFDPAE